MSYIVDTLANSFEKIKSGFEKLINLPNSKVFSDADIHNLNVELTKFKYTLSKTSKGHLVNPNNKPYVNAFAKANYDITKLPSYYREELGRTYNEMKSAINSDKMYYNDIKCANLYCGIYELFSGKSFHQFLDRIQSSKLGKQFEASGESLLEPNSLENYLRDLSLTTNELSEEGIISNLEMGINNAAGFIINTTGKLSVSLNMISSVIIIVLVVVVILAIVMGSIYMKYIDAMNEMMVVISESNTNLNYKFGDAIVTSEESIDPMKMKNKTDRIKFAAKSIDSKMNPIFKATMINPSILSLKYINKISTTEYNNFDKLLKLGEKSTESPLTFFIGGAIIGGLLILPGLLRCAVYQMMRWTLDIDSFLKEENQLLQNDIDEIDTRLNDPNTPKSEKDRLTKQRTKVLGWYKQFAGLSESIEKTFVISNSDAVQDIKSDEKIDFDGKVREAEEQNRLDTNNTINDTVSNNNMAEEPESTYTPQTQIIF